MLNQWRVSGINKLVPTGASDIIAMPLLGPDPMQTIGTVQLANGWPPAVDFIVGTAVLRERSVRENGDLLWEVEILCELNDSEDLNSDTMNARLIAYVEDRAGVGRLVGTKEDPLTLDTSYTTGDRPGSGNKSAFVLRGRLRQRPPYYQL